MSIATLGAFAIGEYPEGVAVMLFYAVGELFQAAAVKSSKENIKALLDVRPNEAIVFRNNDFISVSPETVAIGERDSGTCRRESPARWYSAFLIKALLILPP